MFVEMGEEAEAAGSVAVFNGAFLVQAATNITAMENAR